MKFKLDENLDVRLASLLEAGGHEADTVRDEGLSGSDDDTVYATCRAVDRVLITLGLDFANPFRFPPEDTEGTIVVRPPRPVLAAIRATQLGVLPQLRSGPLKGALWIIEPGRGRIHDPHDTP